MRVQCSVLLVLLFFFVPAFDLPSSIEAEGAGRGGVVETGTDGKGSIPEEGLPAAPTIIYVSTSGDDANNGLSPTTPWQTLAHAQANATSAGLVIALKKGDVFEMDRALGIHHGGTSGAPIIWDGGLWGEGPNAVIRSTSDRAAGEKAVVNIIGCQYVTFQNITVDGNHTDAFGIVVGGTDSYYSPDGYQDSETGIVIQDCEVLNCGDEADDYVIAVLIQTWNTDMSDIVFRRNLVDGASNHTVTAYCGRAEHGATPSELTGLYIGHNTVTNFGINGQDRASGISTTQTVTGSVIEHNTLTQGDRGTAPALVVAGEEGTLPTGGVIRYNNVQMKNRPALVVQNGYGPSVDVYGNLFYEEDASSNAAIWLQVAPGTGYPGASLRFFHNTIVVGQGPGYMDDTSTTGVCSFRNNIVVNLGPGQYGNPCFVVNTAGSTAHSHNAYYRTEPGEVVYAMENDVGYVYLSDVGTWESSAVVGDPGLVDMMGFNWHLKSDSPVIGKGAPIPEVTHDFDGRPYDNPPSIGAFSHQQPARPRGLRIK